MLPVKFFEPLNPLWDLLRCVVGLDGTAVEEIRHDNVVSAGSKRVAKLGMRSLVWSEDIVTHNDSSLPLGVSYNVRALISQLHLLSLSGVVLVTVGSGEGSLGAELASHWKEESGKGASEVVVA